MSNKSLISVIFTYGGFAAVWYQAGLIAAIGTFCIAFGFAVWNMAD